MILFGIFICLRLTWPTEHQRIDAFELWCWRRLLRVPWTARRSNQSILKKISPGCSLEGVMLQLKLQYFGHLMRRADSFQKTLMLGKIEGRRIRGWQRIRWMSSPTQWMWVWVSFGSWWWTGKPGVLQSMGLQRVGHNWVTELTDSDWCEVVSHCSFDLHSSNNEQCWTSFHVFVIHLYVFLGEKSV